MKRIGSNIAMMFVFFLLIGLVGASVVDAVEFNRHDFIDGMAGFVKYDNDTGDGSCKWALGRVRPFRVFDHYSFGLFAKGVWVAGEAEAEDENVMYGYEQMEKVIGLTVKRENIEYWSTWSADVDLGIVFLENEGGLEKEDGEYESSQNDVLVFVAIHSIFYERRITGESWFPTFELDINFKMPVNSEKEHYWTNLEGIKEELAPEEPHDNMTFTARADLTIYDYHFGERNRISPSAFAGIDHKAGEDKPTAFMAGVAMRLNIKKYDVLGIGYGRGFGGNNENKIEAWISIPF